MMLLQPACLHLDSKLHHFPLLQIRIQYKNWNSHEITHKIYIDKQGKMISCQVAFEKEWYILSYDCLRVNTLKGFWSFIFEDFEFKLCLWTLPLKHNCVLKQNFYCVKSGGDIFENKMIGKLSEIVQFVLRRKRILYFNLKQKQGQIECGPRWRNNMIVYDYME